MYVPRGNYALLRGQLRVEKLKYKELYISPFYDVFFDDTDLNCSAN